MNRYSDRERYFSELAETSERYYLDYLRKFKPFGDGSRVLEVGCGEGGNLLPFAQSGCEVVGIDISRGKIEKAIRFFKDRGTEGLFRCMDFLDDELQDGLFDIVIAKDIMEHIAPAKKEQFLRSVQLFYVRMGLLFSAFLPGRCLLEDISKRAENGYARICLGHTCFRRKRTGLSCRAPAKMRDILKS